MRVAFSSVLTDECWTLHFKSLRLILIFKRGRGEKKNRKKKKLRVRPHFRTPRYTHMHWTRCQGRTKFQWSCRQVRKWSLSIQKGGAVWCAITRRISEKNTESDSSSLCPLSRKWLAWESESHRRWEVPDGCLKHFTDFRECWNTGHLAGPGPWRVLAGLSGYLPWLRCLLTSVTEFFLLVKQNSGVVSSTKLCSAGNFGHSSYSFM